MRDGSPPHYGLDFPLNQSFITSHLITPFLPTFTKADSNALQIKKTSWKNLRKFIKALGQDSLILVKEGKDEATILDIDFSDERFKGFTPYRLPRKQSSSTQGAGSTVLSSTDPSVGQEIHISTLYRPKEKLSEFLNTKDLQKAVDIKNELNNYIEREGLVSPDNRRMIKINPYIANTLLDGSHPNESVFLAKNLIPRDTLADIVLTHCSPYHTISRKSASSTTTTASKPKAGHPSKIHIVIETRSGNKTITKVFGLEPFFINAQALADELRKICAGSAGAEKAIGSSDKNPVMEVVVQGPQSDAIAKALEKRGVDKRWIEVQDKTKGKKKR
jgi:translation initiation factor 2D